MQPKGNKISGSGALTAIVCFFLPWVLVSCGSSNPIRSFSGWELAAGTTINSGLSSQEVPGTPVIFLVLVAAFAALLLVYLSWTQRKVFNFQGIGLIALGVISLGIIFWQFNSLQNDVASQSFSTIQVNYQLGFWGEILGFLAVIVGGGFIIQEFSQMSFLNTPNALSQVGDITERESSNLPVTSEKSYSIIPPINGIGDGKQETSSSMELSPNPSSTPIELESQRTAGLGKKEKGAEEPLPFKKIDFE